MMKRYEKYKPSGVDWIGEIPEHWRVKKFKHLYKSSMGATILKTDLLSEGKIPVYSATETDILFGYVDETNVILELGDLVIPARGNSIGHVTIVNGIATCTQTTIYAKRLSDDFSDRFLYHYLKGLRELLFQFDRTAIPQITVGQIKENPVALPPPTEQTAIANYLDEKTTQIDTLITNKQKLIELLKEERTAVINQAVTKGINPNANLKSSGIEWLGDIPAHWEVKKLKYVLSDKLKYGANEPSEFDERDEPRYIRITDFGDDGKLKEDTFKSLPFDLAKEYLLKAGDLLFARSGATVGKTFQFKNYNGKACFAGYLIKASPYENQILSDYLYSFTKSGAYENWKNSIFNQATIQNIGADKYSILEVPVPPIEEQKVIVQCIESNTARIDATISKIEKEIELLQEYRTALISEVVTGKIKVI